VAAGVGALPREHRRCRRAAQPGLARAGAGQPPPRAHSLVPALTRPRTDRAKLQAPQLVEHLPRPRSKRAWRAAGAATPEREERPARLRNQPNPGRPIRR
jgi:hypothetical protein